jgi:hypothetical protein
VAGFLGYDSCTSWDNSYASRLTAAGSCNHGIATDDNTAIPASAIYDAVTNPGGVKCSVAEQTPTSSAATRNRFRPRPHRQHGCHWCGATTTARPLLVQGGAADATRSSASRVSRPQ